MQSAADICLAECPTLAKRPDRRSMRGHLTGGFPMRLLGIFAATLALSACVANEIVDKAMRRTAETVINPVVDDYLPGDQAQTATRCIVQNATTNDLQLLVRDVAVEPGTSTVSNVLAIAGRPETQACFLSESVPAALGGLF
jgi:hypothetical protein